MPIDVYSTYRLALAIKGIDEGPSFLKDRYAPTNDQTDLFSTEYVLAEYRKGDRRLAPFVVPQSHGIPVSRQGQEMRAYRPPAIAPSRPITIDDITKRGFGEAIFTDVSPDQRATLLAMRDMEELTNMIIRREELMTAQVLLENKCQVKEYADDLNSPEEAEVLYYKGKNEAVFTPTKEWNDPDADILGDLAAMVFDLTERGLPAEDFVCAADVAALIINNKAVKEMLDNRRIDIGQARPTITAPGAALMCTLNVYGHIINVISYYKTYEDMDGKIQQYIPSGHGFLSAPNCCRTLYGAVSQVEQSDGLFHTYTGRRVPKYISNAEDDTRKLVVTSHPLVIPTDENASISVQAVTAD